VCVCVCVKLTVDEAQAEPGQSVPVQKLVALLPVALVLKFPPAQHGSNEHQVVAGAGAAQSLFGLDGQDGQDGQDADG